MISDLDPELLEYVNGSGKQILDVSADEELNVQAYNDFFEKFLE